MLTVTFYRYLYGGGPRNTCIEKDNDDNNKNERGKRSFSDRLTTESERIANGLKGKTRNRRTRRMLVTAITYYTRCL